MTRTLITLILFTLAGCSSSSPAESSIRVASLPGHGDLTLHVSYDGTPLQGVVVDVWNDDEICLTAETDEVGDAHFSLPSGKFYLRAELLGLQPGFAKIKIKQDRAIYASAALVIQNLCGPTIIFGNHCCPR